MNTVEACAMSTSSKDFFKRSLKGIEHISHNTVQTPMVDTWPWQYMVVVEGDLVSLSSRKEWK